MTYGSNLLADPPSRPVPAQRAPADPAAWDETRQARRDVLLLDHSLRREFRHRHGPRPRPALEVQARFPRRTWTARARSDGEGGVIELGGEIDAAAVAELRGWLTTSRAAHSGGRLVVDLARVGFLDVVGLNLLVELARLTGARGAVFTLARPGRQPRRLITLAGLDAVLVPGPPPGGP